jgi:hypothetical protein
LGAAVLKARWHWTKEGVVDDVVAHQVDRHESWDDGHRQTEEPSMLRADAGRAKCHQSNDIHPLIRADGGEFSMSCATLSVNF